MAKFFLGQRVRVVACDDPECASLVIGQEGVVVVLDVVNEADEPGNIGVDLNFTDPVDGRSDWCFLPHELEPIIDRHEPCEAEFKLDLDRLLDRQGLSA